jgi:hypothetical protein
MFAGGSTAAIGWLRRLRKTLPRRPFLIADYYGRLERRKGRLSGSTALHDHVQLISRQGLPPADGAEWRAIHSHAGCRPVHIIEDRTTIRFIPILRL